MKRRSFFAALFAAPLAALAWLRREPEPRFVAYVSDLGDGWEQRAWTVGGHPNGVSIKL